MFAVVGAAFVPLLLSTAISIPLGGIQAALEPGSSIVAAVGLLSSLVTLSCFVWHVVLVVIGAALARNISYGQTSGSCAISCGGCLGIIILAIVAIAVIGALFTGALQQ